jgi:hypothetical protein
MTIVLEKVYDAEVLFAKIPQTNIHSQCTTKLPHPPPVEKGIALPAHPTKTCFHGITTEIDTSTALKALLRLASRAFFRKLPVK